ncbi:MAG: methylthioadenosine phosphorylase [Elusimicrobia bacterium CG1_02_56_21]|nr:MAG: methylthioadenosine phosphorylase [Elusimicrobia bacterium CG1_02_56_21]
MAKNILAEIGVIGGSGLYSMEELSNVRELKVKTPFGRPSDSLIIGSIGGVQAAFLPRHGRGHKLLPTEINQPANIWALKSIGVKRLLSVSAVGSLKEDLAPGDFFFPDQFVDETRLRRSTYFGDGAVGHVPLAEPFCMAVSRLMAAEAKKLGIKTHLGGTYCCMEGPGFSTRAESEYHRRQGYSVIGMTVATEAKLAREAGLHYSPVSLVTDYDCWKAGEEVDPVKVIATLHKNVANILRLLVRAIPLAGAVPCKAGCDNFNKGALITGEKDIKPALRRSLAVILG